MRLGLKGLATIPILEIKEEARPNIDPFQGPGVSTFDAKRKWHHLGGGDVEHGQGQAQHHF